MHTSIFQLRTDTLLNNILNQFYHERANELILKFYDLVKTYHKQLIIQNNLQQFKINPQIKKNTNIVQQLQLIQEKFNEFKKIRRNQIINFNQVEYYMHQQTHTILKLLNKSKKSEIKQQQNSSNFIKTLFNNFNFPNFTNLTKLFQKSQNQTNKQNKQEIKSLSETSGSENQGVKRFFDSQREIKSEGQLGKQNKLQNKNRLNNLQKSPTLAECKQIWSNVLQFYQSHRIDQAFSQAEKYQSYIYSYNNNYKLTSAQISLLQTISQEHKTAEQFYSHFYDTGYTFDKQEHNIKLWYKIIEQKDVAIKVQAQLDICIEDFLCIASQIDLFQDYIPFTFDTKQLKSISRNQKIGTSKVYIPLLTDRQTYFYAAAYDCLRTKGSIFFFSKTINQDLEYQQKYEYFIPKQSDLIRLEYKYYILQYIPISKTRGKIKMVSSIDLKMDFLPLFIINKSARLFSFDYIKNFKKISSRIQTTKWQKMKQKKKQTYDYFKQKIDQYLKEKQNPSTR